MRQFVGVVLVKTDGSVLAQLRDDKPEITGPNTYAVIGGAQEDSDMDLRHAGARELKEETNYLIPPNELQPLAEDEYTNERGVQIHRTIFWAPYDETQAIHCNEGQEIRFVNLSEFPELQIYMGHREFLEQASEKTR